jgi:hypothetical protein
LPTKRHPEVPGGGRASPARLAGEAGIGGLRGVVPRGI